MIAYEFAHFARIDTSVVIYDDTGAVVARGSFWSFTAANRWIEMIMNGLKDDAYAEINDAYAEIN